MDRAVEAVAHVLKERRVARLLQLVNDPDALRKSFKKGYDESCIEDARAAIAAHDSVLKAKNKQLRETIELVAEGLQRMNDGDIEPGHPGVARALAQARTALGEPEE